MTSAGVGKLATSLSPALLSFGLLLALPAAAEDFFFNSGTPDGLMGMASRPASAGKIEIEAADDFVLSKKTSINQVSFYGLMPNEGNVESVQIEIYRVFPNDSTVPPSGNVPTRVNSPSDVAFTSRSDASGDLFFTTALKAQPFAVNNSVLNGINKMPGQTTGGEGALSDDEVLFNVKLNKPIVLDPDHYFFVPMVQVTGGNFYWLSAPKPISGAGTTPFAPDLQTWIRNEDLDPDWLRVGTDIVGQGAFNGAFTLSGTVVPEPSTWAQILVALSLLGLIKARRR
jgi:hypothetical protein